MRIQKYLKKIVRGKIDLSTEPIDEYMILVRFNHLYSRDDPRAPRQPFSGGGP